MPSESANRNTLWNSAEAQEKQWNSQLARRFVLAIPREIPRSQHADLIRDYCREFFVSKGMIADFAIHDKGDGNPHAHILLTMRAMDFLREKGISTIESLDTRLDEISQTAEPGKKPSVQGNLKGRQERIRQEQAEKRQPPRTQKQQNMEL